MALKMFDVTHFKDESTGADAGYSVVPSEAESMSMRTSVGGSLRARLLSQLMSASSPTSLTIGAPAELQVDSLPLLSWPYLRSLDLHCVLGHDGVPSPLFVRNPMP